MFNVTFLMNMFCINYIEFCDLNYLVFASEKYNFIFLLIIKISNISEVTSTSLFLLKEKD